MKANFFIKSDDVMMVFRPALSFFFKVTTLAYKKVELHIVYHGLAASQAKLGTMLAGQCMARGRASSLNLGVLQLLPQS